MKTSLFITLFTILLTDCFGQEPKPKEEKIYYDTLKLLQPKLTKEDIASPQDYKHCINLTQSGYIIIVSGTSYPKSNEEELVLFIKSNRKQIIKQKLSLISDSGTSYEKILTTLDIMAQQKIDNYKLVSADGKLPQTTPIIVQSTKPFTKDLDLAESTVLKISILDNSFETSLLNKTTSYAKISGLAKFIGDNKKSIDPHKIVVIGEGNLPYNVVEPVISLLMKHEYYDYHMIPKN